MLGAGVGVGAILLSRPVARTRVTATLRSLPRVLLARVERVEEEPRVIPFVRSVDVERRGADDAVYLVRVCAAGVAGWARFHKRFDRVANQAHWSTLDGFLAFEQTGSISFISDPDGRTLAVVETRTRFALPVVGRAMAQACRPWLAAAFAEWLARLDDP